MQQNPEKYKNITQISHEISVWLLTANQIRITFFYSIYQSLLKVIFKRKKITKGCLKYFFTTM